MKRKNKRASRYKEGREAQAGGERKPEEGGRRKLITEEGEDKRGGENKKGEGEEKRGKGRERERKRK